MSNNRKQYELYSMLGEKPIKDAKEIAFAAGRKKFSKLCGFKFQAPNGKEFEMAFIAKMRSHINHQQKKRVGRQWTIPSRWFCISYSDPKNMSIYSEKDALLKFGFYITKFFLSELFKHESKKLQDIVFKGIEDAKKFALKMDQGPIQKNVLQEIESLELTSELILKDDFEDKTYSITDYSMEKEQISEGWEKYAWKANTKGKLTGENLIKMVLDHVKWNSMTNPIKIYDVHTNHYFDLIDMHVLKNNSGLALDIDTTREASVMESSEEFKKIDDIVAYLKDKKLKWTKVAKFQRINAVLSKGGEEVETIGSDGNKETKRKTKNGDWIVNNVSNPDNKWIIDDKTFKKKYEEHKDGVYKPKGGVMLAAKVSDCEEVGVEFAPPNWSGDVIKIQNDGYFMKDPTNDKDIYAISKKDYDATYKELKDIKENKMNKKSKVKKLKKLTESSVRPEVNKFFVDMKECDGISEAELNEWDSNTKAGDCLAKINKGFRTVCEAWKNALAANRSKSEYDNYEGKFVDKKVSDLILNTPIYLIIGNKSYYGFDMRIPNFPNDGFPNWRETLFFSLATNSGGMSWTLKMFMDYLKRSNFKKLTDLADIQYWASGDSDEIRPIYKPTHTNDDVRVVFDIIDIKLDMSDDEKDYDLKGPNSVRPDKYPTAIGLIVNSKDRRNQALDDETALMMDDMFGEKEEVEERENSPLIKGTSYKGSNSSTANSLAQDTVATTVIEDELDAEIEEAVKEIYK